MEPTRVQNELAAGTSTTRTERTVGSQGIDRPGTAAGSQVAQGSSDQVRFSSLAGRIVRLEAVQSAERAGRIQELSKLYADNRYTVDSAELSRRVVTEWLANGAAAQSK